MESRRSPGRLRGRPALVRDAGRDQTSSEYWATYGLIAAAGLTMALSQILGGWTSGAGRASRSASLLIGFLPVLSQAAGCCSRASPPTGSNTSNWSRDLSIYGLVADVGNVLPAVAFGIGLTFGFSFDTAGPRRDVVAEEHVVRDSDAPLTADATRRRRWQWATRAARSTPTATQSGRP